MTYRNETKQEYLGIDPATLKRPGAVSEKVARLMAERVLERTPEATIAAAVTGHLGPHAPERLDGVVFLAVRMREAFTAQSGGASMIVRRLKLPDLGRDARQRLAVEAVLQLVVETLERKAIKGTR